MRGIFLSVAGLTGAIGLAGCPKAPPDPPAPPPAPLSAEVTPLTVAKVSPPRIFAGESPPLVLLGAGFTPEARVEIGGVAARPVVWRSPEELQVQAPALPVGAHDVRVVAANGAQASLRAGLVVQEQVSLERCGYVVLYFEVDRSELTDQASSLLADLQACYARTTGPLTIEGHADERGTTDYNLQLSKQRADTVRAFLVDRGLGPGRMSVRAWGEERPAQTGRSEATWALNRRVEITLAQ